MKWVRPFRKSPPNSNVIPCEKTGKGEVATAESTVDDVMALDRSAGYGDLKDMPAAIWCLVKNPTYFAISLGACMDAFILAGNQPLSMRMDMEGIVLIF